VFYAIMLITLECGSAFAVVRIGLAWRISMCRNKVLKCMAIAVCAVLASPALRAQSVADAARAAKEKKKKQTVAAPSQAAKSKAYTNDDIPESKSSDPQPAPSNNTNAESKTTPSDAKSTTASGQAADIPHGPDSAHVDFKFTSTTLKRPAKAETLWMVKNTSDHFEHVELKSIISGPCGYRREYPGGETQLSPGQGITNNWQTDLTVLATDCAGTYRLELRASVAGKLLDSASDSITFE
jgi:cytoskeletal protein RodZ